MHYCEHLDIENSFNSTNIIKNTFLSYYLSHFSYFYPKITHKTISKILDDSDNCLDLIITVQSFR